MLRRGISTISLSGARPSPTRRHAISSHTWPRASKALVTEYSAGLDGRTTIWFLRQASSMLGPHHDAWRGFRSTNFSPPQHFPSPSAFMHIFARRHDAVVISRPIMPFISRPRNNAAFDAEFLSRTRTRARSRQWRISTYRHRVRRIHQRVIEPISAFSRRRYETCLHIFALFH